MGKSPIVRNSKIYIYTAPAFLFFEKVAGRKLYRKGQHVSRCACIRRKFIDGKHLS